MKLNEAKRQHSKIKMAVQGPSGSGKSYSALLLAVGLVSNWNKIAVIDTENRSAHLYAHLGPYKVLDLEAPFTPDRYIKALEVCHQAGMECIIIDSITHEWEALLQLHSNMQGNSFTNWGKITPMHSAFVNAILQSPVHIICTMRTKQDYVLADKGGKMVPEKVGLKGIQRDGVDYEFTLVFDVDANHQAKVSKDRTGLFTGKIINRITPKTGELIKDWCNAGKTIQEVRQQIVTCKDLEALKRLYETYPEFKEELKSSFSNMKHQLISESQKRPANGTSNC